METRVTNEHGGVKADGGKPMPSLLHVSLAKSMHSVVNVLTYGAGKYSPDNWRKVETVRYVDAFYRHLDKHNRGEVIDAETGEPHLTAVITNLLFILEKILEARS